MSAFAIDAVSSRFPGIRAMCCTDGHHRKNKNRAGKNPPGNVMLSHADTASAALNLGADDLFAQRLRTARHGDRAGTHQLDHAVVLQ